MTVLPLLSPAPHPDGWHQVTAPGGYERWYFDAEDSANNLRIVASFFDGYFFHSGYLRAYAQYLRRPTRSAPPMPADYRCVYFAVYRDNQIIAQSLTHSPANQFAAAVDRPEVRIGSNHFIAQKDGSFRIMLRGVPFEIGPLGATISQSRQISVSCDFNPKTVAPFGQLPFASGNHHLWTVTGTMYDVTASINLFNAAAPNMPEMIHFTGRGYHDHHLGTRPLADDVEFWFWGRVLLDDRLIAFNISRPLNSATDVFSVLECNGTICQPLATSNTRLSLNSSAGLAVRFPAQVELSNDALLTHPRIIARSPFHLRLVYDAVVRGNTREAFCEIAYPGRLRWPILGRLIERAISSK